MAKANGMVLTGGRSYVTKYRKLQVFEVAVFHLRERQKPEGGATMVKRALWRYISEQGKDDRGRGGNGLWGRIPPSVLDPTTRCNDNTTVKKGRGL
ncbi:PLP-dependent aminotransferase family protein [Sesbania bispinosa]|nr:PLP-dependent aminotransferase family protein [Sesbania bispinosa]